MRVSPWSIVKAVLGILALVATISGGYMAYAKLPNLVREFSAQRPAKDVTPGQEVIVSIPKGASLKQVAGILEDQAVISSRLVFRLVAFIRAEQRAVKAGDYALKTNSDPGDVLDLLISGKTLVFSITVPEGYDMFQVADLFQTLGISSRDEFLSLARDEGFLRELGVVGSSLEGYIFPDTYSFRHGDKKDQKLVVKRMVQRFRQVYDQHVKATADQYGWTEDQVLTLASLIEKEARQSEHASVSAVFHNRLRKKMRLQSDPTVIYGIKPMGSKITRADLDRKHPYNTYQIQGLPPGPIANPGKASLIAAVKPEDADHLYFVSRNDGSHQFSASLKEHNRAVDLYQRNSNGKKSQ